MTRGKAEEVVKALIRDLEDRRGLGQEWEQISDDVQKEIAEAWVDLVIRFSK